MKWLAHRLDTDCIFSRQDCGGAAKKVARGGISWLAERQWEEKWKKFRWHPQQRGGIPLVPPEPNLQNLAPHPSRTLRTFQNPQNTSTSSKLPNTSDPFGLLQPTPEPIWAETPEAYRCLGKTYIHGQRWMMLDLCYGFEKHLQQVVFITEFQTTKVNYANSPCKPLPPLHLLLTFSGFASQICWSLVAFYSRISAFRRSSAWANSAPKRWI